MPRDPSGSYTLPLAPVVTDTPIATTWANPTMDDLAQSMTDSLSRSGKGGMTAVMKLVDTSVGNIPTSPALQFNSESNSGIYRSAQFDIRHSLASVDMLRLYQDGIGDRFFQFWDGTAFQDIIYNGGPANVLANDTFLQGRNAADDGNIDIVKVTTGNEIAFGAVPATFNADIVNALGVIYITGTVAGGPWDTPGDIAGVFLGDVNNSIQGVNGGNTVVTGFSGVTLKSTSAGDDGLVVDSFSNVTIPNGILDVTDPSGVGTIQASAYDGARIFSFRADGNTGWNILESLGDSPSSIAIRIAGVDTLTIDQANQNITIPNGGLAVDGGDLNVAGAHTLTVHGLTQTDNRNINITGPRAFAVGDLTRLGLYATQYGAIQWRPLEISGDGGAADFEIYAGDGTISDAFKMALFRHGNSQPSLIHLRVDGVNAFEIDDAHNVTIPNGTLTVLPSASTGNGVLVETTGADAALSSFTSTKATADTSTANVYFTALVSSGGAGQGQITANGGGVLAFTFFSDQSLKKDITDLTPQLDNINALTPREYTLIDSGERCIGFVAQEFETVYPDAVGQQGEYKTLTGWSKQEARLVSAIQELSAKVTLLEGA